MQDDLGCPGGCLWYRHHIWEDELLLVFVVVGSWQVEVLFCLGHCGEGCRGEGGVALGGRGGAGEEGVEDVVEEGLLLESGW